MQGFGAQTHLFFEGAGPNNLSEQKRSVQRTSKKVTDPIFVNPPPEGLLNNSGLYTPSKHDVLNGDSYASWGPIFLETPRNPDN